MNRQFILAMGTILSISSTTYADTNVPLVHKKKTAQLNVKMQKQFLASIEIGKAKLQVAESLSKTLLDPDLLCSQQFATVHIQQYVSSTLQNLHFRLIRTNQLPQLATFEDILKDYPSIPKVMATDLSYKATMVNLFDRMSQDSLSMVAPLLVGVKVYNQELAGPKEQQASYTFLENGVVRYSDNIGAVTEGTWAVEDVNLYQVFAQIKIQVNGTTKNLALIRNLNLKNLFGVAGYQTALAAYTLDPKNARQIVLDENETYTSTQHNCIAYAQ